MVFGIRVGVVGISQFSVAVGSHRGRHSQYCEPHKLGGDDDMRRVVGAVCL